MLLVPLAHESQRVQRLPWVTFILIGLNVLVFLFTNFSGPDEAVLNAKFDEFDQYLSSHPYLEIRPEIKKLMSQEYIDQIKTLKEAVPTTNLTQEEIDTEQAQLDSISDEILEQLSNVPANKWGYIPAQPKFINLFTCIFVHAGWLHLIGNMLFLYLAGCSIEDLWGRPIYIAFYFLSGIVATWMHAVRFPESMTPLVGASGAIAGLMGAFAVRLYKTRITFFYLIFIRWGTFQAPAYIMLPLWFAQQLLYANVSGESEVAFHAHIGGFIFGAVVALAMKYSGIEEKYLAPAIEKKVSLAQNPMYLEAIEKSEKGDFANALLLLERVVRQEPNHVDAFMEMKRIAEIKHDEALIARYTGGVLDALVRTREAELLHTIYAQYLERPDHESLPAKTLYNLGGYYEAENEFTPALRAYEELAARHPSDPLTMKALSKTARIYFEKQNDPESGKQTLIAAYQHPQSSQQWQSVLQADLKRFGVAIPGDSPASPKPSIKPEPMKPAPPAVSTPREQPPPRASAQTAIPLPHPDFDGDANGDLSVVPCRVQKIVLQGIILNNQDNIPGLLPFKRITHLSSGRVQTMDAVAARLEKETLLFDLIAPDGEHPGQHIIYRIDGLHIPFAKLFPLLEQTALEGFQNFAGIIANSSGATCIPDRDRCLGPVFALYANQTRYETQLREKLRPKAEQTGGVA